MASVRLFPPPPSSGTPRRSRYNSGRWMKEEHEAFLRGVGLFDKDWNLIATVVTTRSVLQIRTHGQKYFTKLEKGEVFPLEPYRSMYDRPSSSSPGSAGSPPQSFLHGGEVLRHQVNGPTNNTSWMGNASFDMSQRNGTNGGGGGGDFSRAQVLKYHCQHQHQAGGQQPMMASLAAPAGSTMIHPMAPSSAAGGAFAHGHSPGSSTKFPSSSAPSPATNWGATSSMDDPHRFGESNGRPVEPASTMSTLTAASLPPFYAASGVNRGSLSAAGYSGGGFAGAGVPGWPGGGVPGGPPEGTNESGGVRVDGRSFYQYSVQQQQQQQQQEHMQACPEGWDHPQGQQPLLPEGLGPLEGWLNSPLLQEEEAHTEDPDGDLALDFVRNFDSLGAL